MSGKSRRSQAVPPPGAENEISASERRFRGRLDVGTVVLLVLSTLIVIYLVVGPHGLLDLAEVRRERARLEERISDLREENQRLREKLDRLQNDDRYLEQMARERLGMVMPDELVVVVPRDKQK